MVKDGSLKHDEPQHVEWKIKPPGVYDYTSTLNILQFFKLPNGLSVFARVSTRNVINVFCVFGSTQ